MTQYPPPPPPSPPIPSPGNIWLPYCLKEAELEMKECYAAGKAFRSGSVVCHENCADSMDRMRHKVERMMTPLRTIKEYIPSLT